MNRLHKRQAQSENEQPTISIERGDKVESVPFFGALDSNLLAVVDLTTLMRLAEMLPKANIHEIINNMIDNLNGIKYDDVLTSEGKLSAYNERLETELRFHKTINQITLFKESEPKREDTVEYANE